jgi:hypothetical protein
MNYEKTRAILLIKPESSMFSVWFSCGGGEIRQLYIQKGL